MFFVKLIIAIQIHYFQLWKPPSAIDLVQYVSHPKESQEKNGIRSLNGICRYYISVKNEG